MQNYEKNDFKQEWMENLTLFPRDGLPREAAASLAQSLDQVFKNREVLRILTAADRTYSENIHMDYEKILEELKDVSPRCGIHTYTLHMLFYIILSRKTGEYRRTRHCARNLPCLHDGPALEASGMQKNVRHMGHQSSAVADSGGLRSRRFALGRFQYELVPFRETYEKDGVSLHPGDLVINVHIPSCGPLKREEYMKSYAMAADFFRDSFKDRPIVFLCESWMLSGTQAVPSKNFQYSGIYAGSMTVSERSITTGSVENIL